MNNENNNQINKAHDHFFRQAMSDMRVAKEFFETHLSADLQAMMDLNKIELESGTFIDDFRRESIADMLFKTNIEDQNAYLYLLVDHQSKPDELMPFRILKYTCNIIVQHMKDKTQKKIPLVIPLVVYHGLQPWNYSIDINDLVDAPSSLVKRYFLKPFNLIDLNKIDDEILKQRAWSGVMELTLKHIFKQNMLLYLSQIIILLKKLEQSDGKNLVENVLTYVLDRGEVNIDEFISLINEEFSNEVGGNVMTGGEQLIARGRREGRQENAIMIARRMLNQGFDKMVIADLTGLSLKQIEALKEEILN